MGKRKCIGILIAALFALLAGPSLSAAQEIERINESFVMGDTGCQMNVVLDGGTGAIFSADLGPAFEPPTAPQPVEIKTDGTWLAWAPPTGCALSACSPADGWSTNTAFDTTGWIPAPIVWEDPCGGTFPAACIWFDSINSGTHNVYFRKTFNITGSIQAATITGGFDDDGQIFMNGNSVYIDTNGYATDFGPLDIASSLVPGTNLIAVHAQDVQPDFNNFHARLVINSSGVPSPPDGIIANSVASPTVQQATAPAWCAGPLTPKYISDTLVCKECTGPDGDGIYTCTKENCEQKTAVERNIMEKSGDGSTWCYYDKLGNRVCKTI